MAKPFLKWAGGKTQLIDDISNLLPEKVVSKEFIYIAPFIRSGAFLFWMLENYPNLKRAIINDANEDLMITYQVIADEPEALIDILDTFQVEYHSLDDDLDKKKELTNGERMYLQYGITGIRGEAEKGYPVVFEKSSAHTD